jgi:hypothetical protein
MVLFTAVMMVYNYVQSQFLGTAYADGTVVRGLLVCSHLTDSSKSDLIAPELRGGSKLVPRSLRVHTTESHRVTEHAPLYCLLYMVLVCLTSTVAMVYWSSHKISPTQDSVIASESHFTLRTRNLTPD